MLTVRMNSIGAVVAGAAADVGVVVVVEWLLVLYKNDSNNSHRNWMVAQVVVTLILAC